MTLFKDRRYLFYKYLLTCYGLWPYQSKVSRRTACVAFFLLNFSLAFPLVAGLTEEWSTKNTIIAKNIASVVFVVCSLIQYTSVYIKRKEMRELYELLIEKLEGVDDEVEVEILFSSIRKGLRMIYFLFFYGGIAAIIALVSHVVPTLVDKPSEENYDEYFPYYYSGMIANQSFRYTLAFLHITFIFAVAIFSYFVISAAYIIFVGLICGMYNVVSYRLKNLDNFDSESSKKLSKKKQDEKIISNIVEVVEKHKETIDELNTVKQGFSRGIFILQLGGFIILSVLLYEVLSKDNKYLEVSLVAVMFLTYLYAFYFNWAGEQILKASDDFFMTTYFIKWYEFPVKARKFLIFIRLKSYKKENLKIGSLWTLSLEHFAWVLKACWTIATVLLSVQKKMLSN